LSTQEGKIAPHTLKRTAATWLVQPVEAERHSWNFVLQYPPCRLDGEAHANPTAGASCGCTFSPHILALGG
jgi:hypothetical protein